MLKATFLFILFFSMFSWAAPFCQYVKDFKGDVVALNFAAATKECQKRGAHLPSAREIAEFAARSGALIEETNFPGISIKDPAVAAEVKQMENLHFSAILDAQRSVLFYFNRKNYVNSKELGSYILWTSTPYPDDFLKFIHGFVTIDASFEVESSNNSFAGACCIKDTNF